MIICELLAVYGEKKYNVFADANDIHQLSHGRDVRKEAAANQLVRSCFSAYDARKHQMLLQGADEMYEFLSSGMEDLQKLGEIFVSDRLKAIRVIPSPKVSVGVSLAENVLELHLNPGNFGMEELAEILSKYDRKKKFYRLRTGEFMDMDEDGIRVLSELRENLQISEAKLKSGEITIPKYRALYLDTRLKEQDDLQVEKNREFRMLIRNMKTAEENDFELPDNLQAQLREYQKTGFWWLKTLCQNGFGGILADDMGLGKTLQTIAFLLSEMQEAPGDANRRSLIVAPASLVYNWESECARFAPELQTRLVAGTQEQRKEMIQNAGMQDILITSYDLLRRDIELYQDLPFFCEIIDEARRQGKRIIVLAGRPYHVDPEVNHGIDHLITRHGAAVVTEDSISNRVQKFPTSVLNQWTYHSRLYAAAKYCTTQKDMDLVQLVSFGCGVDAITTDETREILQRGNKLYTQLKIDEITNLGAVNIRLRSLFAALDERDEAAAEKSE